MNLKNDPTLRAISPADGRYADLTEDLSVYFSEEALIKYRLQIEIEYLIALGDETSIEEFQCLSAASKARLRKLYEHFSTSDAAAVKKLEETTKHDVKAVEYWLKAQLENAGLDRAVPWVHFALTSEDVNNLAYTLMWRDSISSVLVPLQESLIRNLKDMAVRYRNVPFLALTHGQPATPTTFGKEMAVFVHRLSRQQNLLQTQEYEGKLNGATGTWGAHLSAYPHVDWTAFSNKFILSLGLKPVMITTQIISHDTLIEGYQGIVRNNTICRDLCQDIWLYISRGVLSQKRVAKEVGSSTMPHKINPIQFENAEGNLGTGTALLAHLSEKLAVSRMQRDLSGSTVIRNQGLALSYTIVALKNILKGIGRLEINRDKIEAELDSHWEVLAEPIQIVLRKNGVEDAYEQLKILTRGERMTRKDVRDFIKALNIPEEDKKRLLDLSPATYIGLAAELVDFT